MCQAIRDGGRRCSIHKHTSIAVIRAAAHSSGLTRYQVERLFAELRREGANARRLSARQLERLTGNALEAVEGDETLSGKVRRDINLGAEHDDDIDGSTGYALRLIQARSAERAAALNAEFVHVAARAGLTKTEVEEKYNEYMEAVERVRGGEYPEEYTQSTRRRAALANLPYDVASVVALEKIRKLGTNELRRRVQRVSAGETSQIESYGYNQGRLEVVLRDNPEQVLAYHNVPESVWDAMSSSPRPASVWVRSVRNNDDYLYVSASAAEADAYAVRCASCGQFASVSGHSCPELQERQQIVESGVAGGEVRERLAERTGNTSIVQVEGNEGSVEEASEVLPAPETVDEVDSVEPVTSDGSVEEFVLPASDYMSPDIYSRIVDWGDVSEGLPDHIDLSTHFGSNKFEEFSELFRREAPTAESQMDVGSPDMLGTNREVLNLRDLEQVQLVNRDTLYRLRYGRFHELEQDEEFHNKVSSTPAHIYHIVTRDGEGFRVFGTYDERVFTGKTETYSDATGARRRALTVRARGLVEQVSEYTSDEASVRRREGEQFIEALSARDDVAVVDANSTGTKRFVFNPHAPRGSQPRVISGRVAQLRKALREGKVAVIPVRVEQELTFMGHGLADGSGISTPEDNQYTVEGTVAVRRKQDGSLEVLNDERTLKCYCRDYQTKYYCKHLNYVNRNITNVIAKQAHQQERGSINSLLTVGLAGREDVSVVESVTLEDGTQSEPVISFGSELRGNTYDGQRQESRYDGLHNRMTVPASLAELNSISPEEATFEQISNLHNYRAEVSRITSMNVPARPASLRVALKRADVEVPVISGFMSELDAENRTIYPEVKGSITFVKAATPEESSVRTHTLKCNCPDYQETYDCKHIRLTLSQPLIVLNSGSRDTPSGDASLITLVSRYDARLSTQRRILETIRSNPELSEEEAAERVRVEVEAEEAERAERERLRQERLERENAERIAREADRVARIEAANSETVAASELYREAMMERWRNVESPYSENPDRFFQDVKEAERRKANGESPIVFRTENVTDGVCAPGEGTRSFGVELEFDFKRGVNKSEAIRKIGQELHEAGLTGNSNQMEGYHAGARSGWSRWSLEYDATVDAEIVSPIMKDTPERWEELRTVCEIVNRNGGTASVRTGSHVHISTASYGLSTAKHAELLRQTGRNEDMMFRLASNPSRGKHRGFRWCPPNVNDSHGDISSELLDGTRSIHGNIGHRSALNYDASSNSTYGKSHAEFRMWDGSIDPAVIQQQVVVSAALADLAERKVIENDGSFSSTVPPKRTGHYRQKEVEAIGARGTHTPETFKELNSEAAEFIDSIVRTPEQRKGIASLFAITKWQS